MATEAQVSTQDDKLKDARMEVADKPEKVVLPTNESSVSLIRIQHTCAHVMAMAVRKLFPDAKDRIIGIPLIREEVSRDEAHKRITALNEPYKLEILDSIKEDPITIYHIGLGLWKEGARLKLMDPMLGDSCTKIS